MILSNIGTKIINVGSTVLMPGDNMKINAEIATLPAIEAFKEMGFVSIIGDETSHATEPVSNEETSADETSTVKRRGRKPAVEEAPQE